MRNYILGSVLLVSLVSACKQPAAEYTDLKTGETIVIEKDSVKGYMVNKETRKAVYLYVDPTNKDTFYGRTGKVINGNIIISDGETRYIGDEDYVYTDGDYKLKIETDGDIKEKDGDTKVKVGEDGDYKIKSGDYKKKVEADGDIKIKDGDTKIKIEENGDTKVKTKG